MRRAWDSDFFGIEIADVLGIEAATASDFESNGVSLFTCQLAVMEYAAIDRALTLGFSLVQTSVDFERRLQSDDPGADQKPPYVVAGHDDVDEITAIARNAYPMSRFREPWFPPGAASDFYAVWAKRAVFGEFDDACLMIRDSDEIAGFVSVRRLESGDCRIGLIAVAERVRGSGVGSILLSSAASWARERRASRILVNTQLQNIPAMRLYERHGFRVREAHHWLYRSEEFRASRVDPVEDCYPVE